MGEKRKEKKGGPAPRLGQKSRRRGDADDNGHGDSVRPEHDGRESEGGSVDGPPSERASELGPRRA